MIAYPFDRRTGRDRRSGRDRRQSGEGMYVPLDGNGAREPAEVPMDQEEPRKDLAEVWNEKGEELLASREHENARQAFLKAVDIKPEFAKGWYNLAKVHSAKGEKESAMANLKRAVKLDPGLKGQARAETSFKKFKAERDFEKLIK